MSKNLASAGRPRASWLAKNKDVLMSQIVENENKQAELKRENIYYYFQYLNGLTKKWFLKPVATVALALFLMIGYTAAIGAADASLPGDFLYPVKTASERVRMALTFGDENKVQLQMDFLSRRGDELKGLVSKGDADVKNIKRVSETVNKINQDVKEVQSKLSQISLAGTPESIDLVKSIDTKTLAVKLEIAEANAQLSDQTQKSVVAMLSEAIASIDDMADSALEVVVKNYDEGNVDVTTDQIVRRVGNRVENVDKELNEVIDIMYDRLAEGEQQVAGDADIGEKTDFITKNLGLLVVEGAVLQNTSSTATTIGENIKQAEKLVEQSKTLLDEQKYSQSLDSVKKADELIAEIVFVWNQFEDLLNNSQNIKIDDEIKESSDADDDTDKIKLDDLIIERSDQVSESTEEVI